MARHPNILLICTDQHRYDAVSTHPGSAAITPNIAKLARPGVVFERCYSTSPMCSPARASMLTGRYAHAHGLWANGVTLPDPAGLITRQLNEAGYRCGLVGKWHLAAAFQGTTERRVDDGLESFCWAHDPFHGSPENAYHTWLRSRHPQLWAEAAGSAVTPDMKNFTHEDTPFDAMPTEAHYSTWVAEQACDFLESTSADTPFFLMANFFDPHHPFVAPPEYVAMYPPGSVARPVGGPSELAHRPAFQTKASAASYGGHGPSYTDFSPDELDLLRRTYYAMVTLADECIGRILQKLDDIGGSDETLVIFTSDHGEMLGDHALLLKGPMMYEPAIHVPLIVRWPTGTGTGTDAGKRVDALVSIHDIAGTIREAAGIPADDQDQGISLKRVAEDPRNSRGYALAEYRDSGYPEDPPITTTMYLTDRYKLIIWHRDSRTGRPRTGELYDLSADPQEEHNLWGDDAHVSVLSDLAADLVDVRVELEDRSAPREALW